MIICPLCDSAVLDIDGDYVYDYSACDFQCPTSVTLGEPPHKESHFHRKHFSGASLFTEYTIIVQPFFFSWWKQNEQLTIYNEFGSAETISVSSLEEVMKYVKRYQNLKAFA